jgi:uncharacterized membrane protein YjgN (DUF898 family)
MDLQSHASGAEAPQSAFRFTGTWREYAPIAFTNLLLTIVTLGIYRFWARARERRYLWSRTEFIDDSLEWTGTGGEMFRGFLIVMAVLLPTILLLQFASQALILRGQIIAAGLLILSLYIGVLYLVGLAIFRALRYRLSRTYWHGIRGGSDDPGFGYAWSAFWKPILGALAFGALVPWSMTSLWNDRWNKMSFGPHAFEAGADSSGLLLRWFAIYMAPFIGFVLIFATAGFGASGGNPAAAMGGAILSVLAIYLMVGFFGLAYYAAFYRQVVNATSLGPLQFEFTARTIDWFKLILGSVGLIIVTLGLGYMFVGYRNWSFFVRHLEAYGELDLDSLTQSETKTGTDAEGLASAFDIGAI